MSLREGRKLIYGIGNPILSDDAVGIKAAEMLKVLIRDENVDVDWGSVGGFKIIDIMEGYKEVAFIDVIKGKNPGRYYKASHNALLCSFHITSPHTLNLYSAIRLGRRLGYEMPEDVRLYIMEVKNLDEFGERLSEEVEDNLWNFVKFIYNEEIGGKDGYKY